MQPNSFALPASAFLLLSGLPGLSHAQPTAPNFNIPGIPPPGFQHFDNAARITMVKTGAGSAATYLLTADWSVGTFLLQSDPGTSFNVSGGGYHLAANFVVTNNVPTFVPTGSTVTITGTVAGYTGSGVGAPSGPLYSANLIDFGADTTNDATPAALGFKTDNPTGWAAQFQNSPESVYLYGFNVAGLMSSFTSAKFKSVFFNNASAYTTVPVPAAFWLFGSAVTVLAAGWRRRNSASD